MTVEQFEQAAAFVDERIKQGASVTFDDPDEE